jgi:hypothetical protein
VDILHQVVTEARARRQRGETGDSGTGVDSWRADLQPRAAVRARTIPALERERDSLRARLAEVRFFCLCLPPILTNATVDGEGKYGALRGGAGERGGARPGGS